MTVEFLLSLVLLTSVGAALLLIPYWAFVREYKGRHAGFLRPSDPEPTNPLRVEGYVGRHWAAGQLEAI